MRASYQRDLSVQESYQLRGEAAHHLANVVRIELGEEILLMNGLGLQVRAKVSSVSKKEVLLLKLSGAQLTRRFEFDLAFGIPKKEALELSLKQAVELGFRKIYLVRSQYSQTRLPEPERLESLLISALEQSNSAFLPEVVSVAWSEIPLHGYAELLMLDSQTQTQDRLLKGPGARLLIVGPEGGFSPEEISLLQQWPKIKKINLPTPILRTPTAVSAGAGILLGSLLD